jgi:hypothetical protein
MAIRRGSSYAAVALLALASVAAVAGEVFFQEKFEGDSLDPTPLTVRSSLLRCDAMRCAPMSWHECSACEMVGVNLVGPVGGFCSFM